jgi:hypothetical protein
MTASADGQTRGLRALGLASPVDHARDSAHPHADEHCDRKPRSETKPEGFKPGHRPHPPFVPI